MTLEKLLKEKNDRLENIPLDLQTVVEKQQSKVLNGILDKLSKLKTINGQYKIDASNIRLIAEISDELKSVFLNKEYLSAVKDFSKEIEVQATLNDKIIKSTMGESPNPIASEIYIQTAKQNAVAALVETTQFIKPIQSLLETAVINGASVAETFNSIKTFVEGSKEVDSQILKYAKQITNDSFAIADRSYTSIISDALQNDWYYYAGSTVKATRCFCDNRVDNYWHYKEIEAWGNGELLGDCNIGNGKWAGEMAGTNSSTIYSFLGGYNCMHSLIPVSESIVSDSDIERVKKLGFIVL